jgi:hypothetical protein
MRIRFTAKLLSLLLLILNGNAVAASDSYSAHDVKAGILYNLLLFSELPSDAKSDSLVIGVIGKDPFRKDAFAEILSTPLNGKKLSIKRFKADSSIRDMSACRVLFIPSGTFEKKDLSKKLKAFREMGVLTVGEENGFLENGGMVNLLLLDEKKVSFEVNVKDAKRAGVKFRSKLLRLAKRVVSEEGKEEQL